jgi:5'-3' exoribonuclease 2
MGVPAYFRWLSNKYPKIISKVIEELPTELEGVEVPIDISKPNPNGEEFDNLYLDMNNIVHPCFHPEDKPAPTSEEEIMLEIFKYTERLVTMVRPRKLLMMAVDGVAPRAKMNQQRSRRFRSAQDAKEEAENKEEFRKLTAAGSRAEEGSGEEKTEKFDSNVITPGTPFMHALAESLRYWTSYKLSTDPSWANLKVIISDASIPGEGEHKIMAFIRSQRRSQEYDPNTSHVIYGLDADLIMLALALHEPHFRILREDVFANDGKPKTCRICNQPGHFAAECRGEARVKSGEFDQVEKNTERKPYVWLHVAVLREYLEVELRVPNQPFKFDLERAIDDYVFLLFFVGNDFLPHLPSLSIREEGINALISIWKSHLPSFDGYVTMDGSIDLAKCQLIMDGLAKQEDNIFKKRREVDLKREAGAKRRRMMEERRSNTYRQPPTPVEEPPTPTGSDKGAGKGSAKRRKGENFDDIITFSPAQGNSREVREMGQGLFAHRKEIFQAQVQSANTANKSAAAVMKEQLLRKKSLTGLPDENGDESNEKSAEPEEPADSQMADPEVAEPQVTESPAVPAKRKADEVEEDQGTPGRSTPIPKGGSDPNEMPPDDVRLWEDGYADRYYEKKFRVDPKDIEFRHQVGKDYVEGLCWVLLYYMQDCPSWTWYYPHHYAPFAADFVELSSMKFDFVRGTPFRPYEQLMGVLPAASNHAIPKPFRSLMEDEDSPIVDFYPEDFELDLNGKKFKWQGTALLPFIDGKRLLDAMATRYPQLTDDENSRNQPGRDVMYFSKKHPMYAGVISNFYSKNEGTPVYVLNPVTSHGLCGSVEKVESYIPETPLPALFSVEKTPGLDEDGSMSVYYDIPKSTNIHKSQLLRGLNMPAKKLTSYDMDMQRHRTNNGGRNFGYDNTRRYNGPPNPAAGRFDPNSMGNPPPPGTMPFGQGGPPPPPWLAAQMGFVPPPPPGFGGVPPRPQNGNGHQSQQGGYGGNGYGGNHGGQQGGQQYDGNRNGNGNGGQGGRRDYDRRNERFDRRDDRRDQNRYQNRR